MWVAETQVLEPSLAASQDAHLWEVTSEAEEPGLEQDTPTWDAGIPSDI